MHWLALPADRGVSGEAIAEAYDAFEKGKISSPLTHASLSAQTIQESMKLLLLVRSYQVGQQLLQHAHLAARRAQTAT